MNNLTPQDIDQILDLTGIEVSEEGKLYAPISDEDLTILEDYGFYIDDNGLVKTF